MIFGVFVSRFESDSRHGNAKCTFAVVGCHIALLRSGFRALSSLAAIPRTDLIKLLFLVPLAYARSSLFSQIDDLVRFKGATKDDDDDDYSAKRAHENRQATTGRAPLRNGNDIIPGEARATKGSRESICILSCKISITISGTSRGGLMDSK